MTSDTPDHRPADGSPTDPAGAADGRTHHILIVDDDLEVRSTVSSILKHFGFTTRVACDGREALDRMRESLPDLLISDVLMPNMNGFQLLMEVHNRWPDLPVILISGNPAAGGNRPPRLSRRVDFLEKPFDLSRVVTLVQGKLSA
jgi:DNA-binding NtrC family response regulator